MPYERKLNPTPALEKVFGKASRFSVRLEPAAKLESAEFKRHEAPFLRVIPCARGRKVSGEKANLFIHSDSHVGFVGKGMRLRKELLAVEGARAHQTGDEEFSVVFPAEQIDAVAKIVRPRLKRQVARAVGHPDFRDTDGVNRPAIARTGSFPSPTELTTPAS